MKKITMILLLISAVSLAQANSSGVKIFGNVPTSKIEAQGSSVDGAPNLGVGIFYEKRISPRVSLGVEYDWLNRGESKSTEIFTGFPSSVSGDSHLLLGTSKFHLPGRWKLSPYILTGAGLAIASIKGDLNIMDGFVWADTGDARTRNVINDSAVGFGWTIRGGFDYPLAENVSIGFELGYAGTNKMKFDLTEDGKNLTGTDSIEKRISSFITGLSITYRY